MELLHGWIDKVTKLSSYKLHTLLKFVKMNITQELQDPCATLQTNIDNFQWMFSQSQDGSESKLNKRSDRQRLNFIEQDG